MNDLVIIDKKFPECSGINTEAWLDHVLGPNLEAWQAWLDELDERQTSYNEMMTAKDPDCWVNLPENRPYTGRYWIRDDAMQRAISDFLVERTEREYVPVAMDNVYNSEQDFCTVFQFQVWVPETEARYDAKREEWTCDEWYYCDDVFVAVEIHRGGDVRGNYGTVQLRGPVDSLCDAGFLDWGIGWMALYAGGEPDRSEEAERMSMNYSSYAWGQVEAYCKWGPRWSDKRQAFVAINHAGRCVELHPDYYANGA